MAFANGRPKTRGRLGLKMTGRYMWWMIYHGHCVRRGYVSGIEDSRGAPVGDAHSLRSSPGEIRDAMIAGLPEHVFLCALDEVEDG